MLTFNQLLSRHSVWYDSKHNEWQFMSEMHSDVYLAHEQQIPHIWKKVDCSAAEMWNMKTHRLTQSVLDRVISSILELIFNLNLAADEEHYFRCNCKLKYDLFSNSSLYIYIKSSENQISTSYLIQVVQTCKSLFTWSQWFELTHICFV